MPEYSISLKLGNFECFLSFNVKERKPVTLKQWNFQSLLESWRARLLRCVISWCHQLFGCKTDNDECSR